MRPRCDIKSLIRSRGGQIIRDGDDGFAAQIHAVRMICSWGGGWERVSVSLERRCPTWREMCDIKDLCFGADETAVQYHPAKREDVNRHPYCLHLWRPLMSESLPKPPSWMVGPSPPRGASQN